MDSADRTDAKPLWKRMLLSAGRTTLTLGIIGSAVTAGLVGHSVLSSRASAVETPLAAPLTSVAPNALMLEKSIRVPRRFTGQFEAAQEVALGFEEGGTIQEVSVREGELVEEGTVLARLDTRLLDAERQRLVASRAAIGAQEELARRTNQRQSALLAEGHVTRQRIDETSLRLLQLEATLSEIDAAIAMLDVRKAKSVIRAPFDGRIGNRALDTGAVAGPGAEVLTLLQRGSYRFRVALDPSLASDLTSGAQIRIETATGHVSARLSELAPDLDPATRSRIAFFELDNGHVVPPAGATGEVVLHQEQEMTGAWVSLSALRQGPRGTWTLLTVEQAPNDTFVVGQEAAEVLHLDSGRAFVRGSFRDATLYLPGGTHRVVPGEVVRLTEAE